MKINLNDMTRRFLLGENQKYNVMNYIQALRETLHSLQPRTQTDYRRIEIAKEHLREIRKHTRKLEERVGLLEEQLRVLEEGKS